MNRRYSVLVTVFLAVAISSAQDRVDLSVVNRIKAEAFQNSKVMDYLFYLTDVNGPRLAGSPGYRSAAEWCIKSLKELGLEDAKLEKWGTFGRGWSFSHSSIHMLAPQETPLSGVPQAWTPGTDGPVRGEVVFASIGTEADFEKFKGKLNGRIVLFTGERELKLPLFPLGQRYSDADLTAEALAPEPDAGRPTHPSEPPQFRTPEEYQAFRNKLNTFLKQEGVLAVLMSSTRGDGGMVHSSAGGSRELKDPVAPPTISLMTEHYNRIARLIDKKVPVKLEIDVRARFHDETLDGYNVVGDLPGGRKKDEVVMIGGHLDSWHGGTGAADNAAGVAVMLEAVRILQTLGVKLDRTVRVGFWDAEEEGLYGSKGYVKEHFADRDKMALKKEHARLSGYFNFDNGAGKIRGVYLQNNDMMRPVFESWLAPFKDMGASTISIRNTGGTDHLAFDAVGLPGFQFIQDPLDYSSRVHHTNLDVYDRVPKGDLMQASAIIASFVYNAATRSEMLPRKPLPKPAPKKEEKKQDLKDDKSARPAA